jgi:hypothetical protein
VIKIDKHIGELLYDHECVIVPELGGFLSSYMPSKIHSARHIVMPPSKKIAFNIFLKQNDGLLANHVVQSEQLTYPEALKEIEDYVEGCFKELGAGKKFIIEQVGVLSKDAETNIQFEPFGNVNFLKDSFGLSPVKYVPVTNTDFELQVEKQLHDFISLRPSQSQPRSVMFRRKARLNAMNTMLLTGSILWLCLNLYIVSPTKVNFASLNPFSAVRETTSSEISKPQIYTQPSVAHTETIFVKTTVPVAPESVIVSPSKELAAAINTKEDVHSYFIIAAAFKSMANANKKADELKSHGFPEAEVIVRGDGFKLVCYKGYSTRENAVNELEAMQTVNKDAWIFSK